MRCPISKFTKVKAREDIVRLSVEVDIARAVKFQRVLDFFANGPTNELLSGNLKQKGRIGFSCVVDCARTRFQQPGCDSQQSGLSGSVAADNRNPLALFYR